MSARAAPSVRRSPGRRVVLKSGREKPIGNRHPWIFSGAIESVGEGIEDGAIAEVVGRGGDFLARGMVSLRAQITVRILSFDPAEAIDTAFWERRLRRSFEARPAATPR